MKRLTRIIGLMGAALTAGAMMGVGCSDGGSSGGYYYADNQPGGNGGNGGNGGIGGNGGNETGTGNGGVPGKTYGTPYVKNLDNGFTLHNFMGDEPYIGQDTVVDDVNYYLGKTETTIKGLVNQFSSSLANRDADTKNYFKEFINGYQNNNHYAVEEFRGFDNVINTNFNASKYIFEDIIQSLGANERGGAFVMCYEVLEAQAFAVGSGTAGKEVNGYDKTYDRLMIYPTVSDNWESNALLGNINLKNDINNGCKQITAKINDLLGTAANNMTQTKKINIDANDLRQVLNLALTSQSLYAMHEYTTNTNCLKHNDILSYSETHGVLTMHDTMLDAATAIQQTSIQQTQEMGL